MRWVASMVAEVHRILTRGGIFMYPLDSKMMANGTESKPKALHQRVPVFLGSKNEVQRVIDYHTEMDTPAVA